MALLMRLPRVQFTVRQMMIAVAVIGVVFLVTLDLPEAAWDGSASVPLEFLTLDCATGHPINGATIRLAEGNTENRATTGPDGSAKLVIRAITGGRSSAVRNTRIVVYTTWSMAISADGYEGLNDDLGKYTQGPRFHSDLIPPPIVIRLPPERSKP